jgi:hypothetical protein
MSKNSIWMSWQGTPAGKIENLGKVYQITIRGHPDRNKHEAGWSESSPHKKPNPKIGFGKKCN